MGSFSTSRGRMDVRKSPRLLFLVILSLGAVVPLGQPCPCEDLGEDHVCSRFNNGTGRYVVFPNALKMHLIDAKRTFEALNLHVEHPLTGCHMYVDEYLCVLFFPVCKPIHNDTNDCQQLGPCQELCEAVNKTCRDELEEVKAVYPDVSLLEVPCSNLPTFKEAKGGCVVHIDGHTGTPAATPSDSESTPAGDLCGSPRACTNGLVQRTGSMFAGISDCAEPCPGVLTSSADKVFATAWLSIWSSLCLLFSAFTIVCWVVSYRSYHYPLTPILHIAICYAGIALSYVLALAAQEKTTCYLQDESVAANSSSVADGNFASGLCTFTFFVSYFFAVASWCWWIVIAVTWFLQASLKFHGSNTERKGLQALYHVLSWGVPLVLTVTATATQSYGANSITLLCQVSARQSRDSTGQIGFIVFMLVPQMLAVVVCMGILLVGHLKLLISADSSKRPKQTTPPPQQQQQQQSQCSKEWSLADQIKADIFCVVFLVQMTVSSSVNMYHFRSLPEWEQYHIACDRCQDCNETAAVRPLFGVFMWKLAVELLIGCLLVLWLKPRAVLNGWKAMFKCLSKSDSQRISTPTTPTWSQTSV